MTDVAIVTGGSSGLGLEIARLLAARGLAVVDVSRRTLGDASRVETAQAAIAAARQRGELRLLVNCAGVGVYGPAGSYDAEAIRRVIDANLVATVVFCNAVFPILREAGEGAIVNVLSTAALIGKPNETVYCAAKWGARGYTEALRAEAKGTGVRVMAAAPGGMRTPFWNVAPPNLGSPNVGPAPSRPNPRTPDPYASFMSPAEVAQAIVEAVFAKVAVTEIVIQRT